MANVFDQFDGQAPAAAAQAGNVFDRFDPPKRSAGQDAMDVAIQVPTGFNEGVAKVAGAPVDAMTWVLDKIPGVDIKKPFGGSESIMSGMGLFGADPRNQPATTPAQRVARGTGEGIAYAIVPEGELGALRNAGVELAPRVADTLSSTFGRAESGPATIANASVGAGAGGGQSAAEEFVPEPYKPIAGLVGGLVGGGLGVGTVAATRGAGVAGRAAADYVAPLTESGRERLAADTLAGRASDPKQALEAIEDRPASLVAGSEPTTFQVTGDMGLGSLEREVATRAPADFNQRRADQNVARTEAVRSLQNDGSPADVANFFRSQLADLDSSTERTFTEAADRARSAAADIGGNRPAEAYGADIQASIAPRIEQATTEARGAVQQIGGAGQPEGYGASLRGSLGQARTEAKRQERALWNAVDPDNTLTLPATRLKSAAAQLEAGMSQSAKPIAGEEREIFDIAKAYGDNVPLREITDLRSRVSTAMREERRAAGETPVYGRLQRLREAIEGTISDAVSSKASQESQDVAAGRLPPERALETRLNEWVSQFRARSGDASARPRDEGLAARRGAGAARVSRTAGAPGAGSGGAQGDQGLSGEALQPIDAAAQDRLRAATAATRERKRTFDEGTVGGVLRSSGMQGQYRTIDAAVPAAIFKPGPGGYEAVQAYRRAIGNDQAALATLSDYAASSMRRATERADGTIDPARYASWRRQHQDALRAVPELAPLFDAAARASEPVAAFAPVAADVSPAHLPETFFHSGTGGYEDVQRLRALAGNDTTALRMLSDYAASRLRQTAVRADGTLDPARFETWRRAHQDALRAFPELEARFGSAARASEAMAETSAARKESLDAFQKDAVGKLIGVSDPADVTRVIGGIFGQKNAVDTMRGLAEATKDDAAARAGLRKAIVDHIDSRFISNTEGGTSGAGLIKADQFQTFIRQNAPSLSHVFDESEMSSLRAIAADLKRANRSITAVKLPGGSNTAQDTAERQMSLLRSILQHSVGAMIGAGAGAGAGHFAGFGPIGSIAGTIGGVAVSAMRDAGIKQVDDLVKMAMLDPNVARMLLQRAANRPDAGPAMRLAQYLRRATAQALYQTGANPPPTGERNRPVRLETPRDVHAGAERTDEPSPAQAAAGNYRKRHLTWKGLDLTIETERGQDRSGIGADGRTWNVSMQYPYGYIKGTKGGDGDQIDVTVGPHPHSQHVFVFDQVNPQTGRFDEHKLVIGARDLQEAASIYDAGFSDGSGSVRRGAVKEMSVPELKQWLANGNTRRPVAYQTSAARSAQPQNRYSIRPTLEQLFEDKRPAKEIEAELLGSGLLTPTA